MIVNTVHGLYALPEDPLAKRAVVYALERLAAACSHAELVQNPEDLATLRRIGVSRAEAPPAGQRRRPRPLRSPDAPGRLGVARRPGRAGGSAPTTCVVGAVGRLVREKGYAELFEAAAPAARPVAPGPARRRRADRRRQGRRVTAPTIEPRARRPGCVFLGRRDDVDDVYAAHGPLRAGLAPRGLPPLGHGGGGHGRCPSWPPTSAAAARSSTTGVTGLLVPVRDGPAPGRCHRAPGRRPERGGSPWAPAGRRKALRQFDQQRVIDRTLAVYERLLAASRAGSGTGAIGR